MQVKCGLCVKTECRVAKLPLNAVMCAQATMQFWRQIVGEARAKREAALAAAEAAAMKLGGRIRMQLAMQLWLQGTCVSQQEKQR
jgi:hypothetical protein